MMANLPNPPLVFLERFAYMPTQTGMGTFGKLTIPERNFSCYTVEQDWEDNTPWKSCIPEGGYVLKRSFYHRGNYECFEVMDVPRRQFIKIHMANFAEQLFGCIAPGKVLGSLAGGWGVKNSTGAFNEFMSVLEDVDQTTLYVRYRHHGPLRQTERLSYDPQSDNPLD